jgi:hypothetical protein
MGGRDGGEKGRRGEDISSSLPPSLPSKNKSIKSPLSTTATETSRVDYELVWRIALVKKC